jgi:hypothetical protein
MAGCCKAPENARSENMPRDVLEGPSAPDRNMLADGELVLIFHELGEMGNFGAATVNGRVWVG